MQNATKFTYQQENVEGYFLVRPTMSNGNLV